MKFEDLRTKTSFFPRNEGRVGFQKDVRTPGWVKPLDKLSMKFMLGSLEPGEGFC